MEILNLFNLSNDIFLKVGDWTSCLYVAEAYRDAHDITIGDAIERRSRDGEASTIEYMTEVNARLSLGDDDDELAAVGDEYRRRFLRACDDHFGDMVQRAALDYLIERRCCWRDYITDDDWNKVTDALAGITRENTWGDIYDIIDGVITAGYNAFDNL